MNQDKQWKEWKMWQVQMNTLTPNLRWACRQYAVKQLVRELREMECEGCGISSSDGNHKMFSIWKHDCGKDFDKFLRLCITGD